MFTISSFMRQAASAALVVAAAAAGPAHAVDIQTATYTQTGIGSDFASPYDNFTITGQTITIVTPTTPVAVSLGTYSFEVGPNCWSCALTPSFDALIDVTLPVYFPSASNYIGDITFNAEVDLDGFSSGPTIEVRWDGATLAPGVEVWDRDRIVDGLPQGRRGRAICLTSVVFR